METNHTRPSKEGGKEAPRDRPGKGPYHALPPGQSRGILSHLVRSISPRRSATKIRVDDMRTINDEDSQKDEDMETFSLDEARVLKATARAILVSAPGIDSPEWVPKSVISDDSEVGEGEHGPGALLVPEWFAREKGWS